MVVAIVIKLISSYCECVRKQAVKPDVCSGTLKGAAVWIPQWENDCVKYFVFFCGHVDEKGPYFHEILLFEGMMKMLLIIKR